MQSIIQTVYYSKEILTKKPHFHDCHQIMLILRGHADFNVNGALIHANAGDVAIFSRYENHSVCVISEEYERYVLHIDPKIIHSTSPVYFPLTDRPAGFCNVINVSAYLEDITAIFRRLIHERSSICVYADEMEQLLIQQLLITIYRCTDIHWDSLHDEVVIAVKRQFENHYNEQYTLEGIAKQYHVSISTLSHRFRTVTGTSVMEYLQACRIAHAKRMLADTNTRIGEIVEKCGFSDSSNFSRTFKKLNGISPSVFRKIQDNAAIKQNY